MHWGYHIGIQCTHPFVYPSLSVSSLHTSTVQATLGVDRESYAASTTAPTAFCLGALESPLRGQHDA